MKYRVLSVTMLLSTALAVASCAQLPHEKTVGGQRAGGKIIIYDKQKSRSCSLEPTEGKDKVYKFKDGCGTLPNDEAYYFKMDGVPSAVLVTFHDDGDCGYRGNFTFQVRTMQSPTTLDPILLSDAAGRGWGEMLAPGLRLEWKFVSGKVQGKLSCVEVKY